MCQATSSWSISRAESPGGGSATDGVSHPHRIHSQPMTLDALGLSPTGRIGRRHWPASPSVLGLRSPGPAVVAATPTPTRHSNPAAGSAGPHRPGPAPRDAGVNPSTTSDAPGGLALLTNPAHNNTQSDARDHPDRRDPSWVHLDHHISCGGRPACPLLRRCSGHLARWQGTSPSRRMRPRDPRRPRVSVWCRAATTPAPPNRRDPEPD